MVTHRMAPGVRRADRVEEEQDKSAVLGLLRGALYQDVEETRGIVSGFTGSTFPAIVNGARVAPRRNQRSQYNSCVFCFDPVRDLRHGGGRGGEAPESRMPRRSGRRNHSGRGSSVRWRADSRGAASTLAIFIPRDSLAFERTMTIVTLLRAAILRTIAALSV